MPEKNTGLYLGDVTTYLRVNCRGYFFFAMLMLSLTAAAQNTPPRKGSRIIDDTTKQVYGPNTSRYFYEQEVFYNREMLHPIDTLIKNFHRWNFVQRYNNLYQ